MDPRAEGALAVIAVVHVEKSSFGCGGTGCHLKDVVYLMCKIGRAYADICLNKSWRMSRGEQYE